MKFPPRCDRWRVLRFHLCGSFPPATPTLKSRCAHAHPTFEKQQQPQKQKPLSLYVFCQSRLERFSCE